MSDRGSGLRPIKWGTRISDHEAMGWRHRLLELLARGVRAPTGERLEPELIVRLHDRIAADPELSARLDSLDKSEFCSEFLALYEAEEPRDS